MAEAAVHDPNINKCYCHQCRKEIYPKLPDYICPTCSGGFIEDLEEVLGNAVQDDEPSPNLFSRTETPSSAQRVTDMWGQRFLQNFMEHSGQDSNSSTSSNDGDDQPGNSGVGVNIHFAAPGNALTFTQFRGGHGAQARGGAENIGVNPLQSLIEPLLLGLTGQGDFRQGHFRQGRAGTIVFGPPIGGGIHGNVGDYAWGEGGLDVIITHLMNQLEGSGPPPADDEKINGLPVVKIEEHHVGNNLQCNICFEDYKLGEEVKQLPCQHLYHKDCITPWLRQHGTCPVCRKNLDGSDTTCDQNEQSIPDVLTNLGVRGGENQGNNTQQPTPGASGRRNDEPSANLDYISLDEDDDDL